MPETIEQADEVFKAFADATRLRILALLSGRRELCVCEIMSVLKLPQAKVSRHLATLRRAGLVRARRQEQWMYYRLAPAKSKFHRSLLRCLNCCAEVMPECAADAQRLGAVCCANEEGRS